ncbi:MAG: Mov34/MPN/PAD-1 family protein [Acidimicrobiales bacterium]|nr:Mov34/MPN/PAD-1 family protein [Acidimicrobiales bacterium]
MLTIPTSILVEARTFFEDRGALGCEGTAMIAGTDGVATKLVVPEQHANPVPYCSVEVTRQGKSELALALGPDDRYVARIHSHPALAFHSASDDANPAITYPGALSIVVPFFGLGLRQSLDACAVLVRRDRRWLEVPAGPDRNDLVVAR